MKEQNQAGKKVITTWLRKKINLGFLKTPGNLTLSAQQRHACARKPVSPLSRTRRTHKHTYHTSTPTHSLTHPPHTHTHTHKVTRRCSTSNVIMSLLGGCLAVCCCGCFFCLVCCHCGSHCFCSVLRLCGCSRLHCREEQNLLQHGKQIRTRILVSTSYINIL